MNQMQNNHTNIIILGQKNKNTFTSVLSLSMSILLLVISSTNCSTFILKILQCLRKSRRKKKSKLEREHTGDLIEVFCQ